jgi:hypothetical protein
MRFAKTACFLFPGAPQAIIALRLSQEYHAEIESRMGAVLG